jgi:hypothetical protein
MEELSKVLFGAVGGGLAATVFRLVDEKLDSRRKERESAQATLKKYAKPLWLAAHDLEFRLGHMAHLKNRPALKFSPPQGHQLDWYVKYGYYATSTAYLISCVASWLGLFQRDVVFLDFGKESQSARFFRLIEDFRATLSQSILWHQYIDGIGSELVEQGARQPMTFSAFCRRLHQDETFRIFYDQLFQFLAKTADGEYEDVLAKTLDKLRLIMSFLSDLRVVPNLSGAVEPGI